MRQWCNEQFGAGGPCLSGAALALDEFCGAAGAYTRQLFSSTWAVSDAKYTLHTT